MMAEIKIQIQKTKEQLVGVTINPPYEVRISDTTDTISQVLGMTDAITNSRFKSAINRRSPRYSDKGYGQCGNRGGYFNHCIRVMNRRNNKKNEEGKDSFTGYCADLKKFLFVLDGKQIVNF